ncbi:Protein tpx2 [Rhizoclosmatium sp. JEL0117]|nr:Protein tpx2 [Rhizoclosmatium sp. JEL0117]
MHAHSTLQPSKLSKSISLESLSSPASPSSSLVSSSSTYTKAPPSLLNLPQSASVDAAFEFAAPKYVDFDRIDANEEGDESANPWSSVKQNNQTKQQQQQQQVDAWFDNRHSSPLTGPSRVARPSALLAQLDSDIEVEEYDDTPTPKASEKRVRPKTAGPVRPEFKANQPVKPRPMTASHTSTGAARPKSSAPTKEVSRLFSNLSLTATKKKTPTSDPEAKARLLASTAAWNARRAAVAAEETLSSRKTVSHDAEKRGPTVPKEFSFMGRPKMVVKSPGIKKRKPVMKKTTTDLTVPKPFRFHETHSHSRFMDMKADADKSPFVPLVNRVKQFEEAVPDRFKPVPKKSVMTNKATFADAYDESSEQAFHVSSNTVFLSVLFDRFPHFSLAQSSLKSTEEMELEEMTNAPKFKAHPVNKKILKEPHIGAPPPPKPALTVPQSPAISKPRPPPPAPKPPSPKIKANPIRYLGVKPFEPVLEHRRVVAADVKLPGEAVRERKLREFEEEVRRGAEEMRRRREFKASGVPDLTKMDPLPEVKPKPVTEPVPFHFLTDSLPPKSAFGGEIASLDLVGKFVAQPVPQVEPFVPKKSNKPVTMPEPVLLHTDSRVEERRGFEEMKREREREEAEAREQARLAREEEERMEIRRMRQEQVFHAQPVRTFPGIQIHASQKRLTEPESPMLREKRERVQRMRERLMKMSPRRGGSGGFGRRGSGEVAVAAESARDLFAGREVPGEEEEEEEEEEVPTGEFEAVEVEERGRGRRKEWGELKEWSDDVDVASSPRF